MVCKDEFVEMFDELVRVVVDRVVQMMPDMPADAIDHIKRVPCQASHSSA